MAWTALRNEVGVGDRAFWSKSNLTDAAGGSGINEAFRFLA